MKWFDNGIDSIGMSDKFIKGNNIEDYINSGNCDFYELYEKLFGSDRFIPEEILDKFNKYKICITEYNREYYIVTNESKLKYLDSDKLIKTGEFSKIDNQDFDKILMCFMDKRNNNDYDLIIDFGPHA